MPNIRTAQFLLLFSALTAAQRQSPFELASDQLSPDEPALAHRRAAEFEAWQMLQRLNAFAEAWNAFLAEYSAHGAFNVKKARAALKAWRKIEPSLPR